MHRAILGPAALIASVLESQRFFVRAKLCDGNICRIQFPTSLFKAVFQRSNYMGVSIKFLGASGTVTGSKYLVQAGSTRILVDAGIFQGDRRWREENWSPPFTDMDSIDAVLLTHAHIDHTGMLPRFYQQGLRCPIYCSRATHGLSQLLLPDSGRLQEEEAQYRAERSRSRHNPVLPLYTEDDARNVLTQFRDVPFSQRMTILDGVHATWRRMGHILGAASIVLEIGNRVITFSGDIGRYGVPILKDPEPAPFGDLLLIESTYGDSEHAEVDPEKALGEVVNRTIERRGVLVIPSFAVGRAQSLLYYFRALKERRAIPDIPVVVDSPMASDATALYSASIEDYDEAALGIVSRGKHPFSVSKLGFTRDRNESIRLNSIKEPMVIISASGMLSGGRILHHLKHRISDARNTILFVGHQPEGGRGDWLLKGEKTMRILGEDVSVRAEIALIGALSAHGDRGDLLRWCRESQGMPSRVAVVHGEPEVAQRFVKTLNNEFSWSAFAAQYRQEIEI